jgi:ribonucleoside-triphosphate reductase (formate)
MIPKRKESYADTTCGYITQTTSIVRRNGRVVPFKPKRIFNAIIKAGAATGQFDQLMADTLTQQILEQIDAKFRGHTPSVEQVQDIVEDILIRSPFAKTAKAYIVYRSQHTRIRELASRENVVLMQQYLDRDGWAVRENSNMGYSLQGLNNYVSSEVSKQYWLEEIYTPEIREAHRSGDFHIHDLGLLAPYCVGWDLTDLLRRGFRGVPGKVATSPAKHFSSALGQIVNFFYTLQGEAAGAQAFSHFDTLLAPFIRYDGLDYQQVKQALQSFVFNLNVPTRVGFSTPFTNLTLDLMPPTHLQDVGVILGGQVQNEKYRDYQPEMDLLNAAFLDVLAEGDADGRVFTFPIPTYNITPDFDWDNPAWSELWEVTAKYGIPYFANFIGSDMSLDDTRSMCCRLRLDLEELRRRGGGLFGSNPLTGSIGVVTLNMSRIGYLAEDEADFMTRVDRLMELARDSLEIKRKILERFTENELYPYAKSYLEGVHSQFGEYWHNHFATIGLVGMNEACLNFLGRDIGSRRGQGLAAHVLEHMRERLSEFQETTGHVYNLEATPAEGTSYRLARIDREQHPRIMTAAEEESEPFYTNSTQLPVGYTTDIFRALALQDDLQAKYTGGTVQHVYLGESAPNAEAVKAFIRKVCETCQLPYLTITPTFSICPLHGYLTGKHEHCPECRGKVEVYSRVVGYLRPVDQWNDGKQAEFRNRATYRIEGGER